MLRLQCLSQSTNDLKPCMMSCTSFLRVGRRWVMPCAVALAARMIPLSVIFAPILMHFHVKSEPTTIPWAVAFAAMTHHCAKVRAACLIHAFVLATFSCVSLSCHQLLSLIHPSSHACMNHSTPLSSFLKSHTRMRHVRTRMRRSSSLDSCPTLLLENSSRSCCFSFSVILWMAFSDD